MAKSKKKEKKKKNESEKKKKKKKNESKRAKIETPKLAARFVRSSEPEPGKRYVAVSVPPRHELEPEVVYVDQEVAERALSRAKANRAKRR